MTDHPDAIFEQLARGLDARLTLILAKDGSPEPFRRWLSAYAGPCARHVLTEADNEPTRFLDNLTRALRTLLPAPPPPRVAPKANLLDGTAELLNALLEVNEDFAVVLEDYHMVTAPAVHATVSLMVDYPPPRMHLYVVSRIAPPLPLPRLRVRQQLVEIDLRGGQRALCSPRRQDPTETVLDTETPS